MFQPLIFRGVTSPILPLFFVAKNARRLIFRLLLTPKPRLSSVRGKSTHKVTQWFFGNSLVVTRLWKINYSSQIISYCINNGLFYTALITDSLKLLKYICFIHHLPLVYLVGGQGGVLGMRKIYISKAQATNTMLDHLRMISMVISHPPKKINTTVWAMKKNPPTFHFTGWLLGILINGFL